MNRNNCLILLKFFAYIGVVFIHVTFPGTVGMSISYFFGFAVPLFLMVSGYYSYNCDVDKIKIRTMKIFKLLLFGLFWYFMYNVIFQINDNNFKEWWISNFNWKALIQLFFFSSIDWARPLWYLIAMIQTYVVWGIASKKEKQYRFIKYTWLLMIVGTVLTIIVESSELQWCYKINFLYSSLPWFMFGYLVKHKFEIKLSNINNVVLIIFAIVGWIISVSAAFINCDINYNYIGIIITAPSLFLIGVKNPKIHISKPIQYIGDNLSPFIYIFHPLVSRPVGIVVKLLGIYREGAYLYFHPLMTLFITMIISFSFELIYEIQGIKKYIY